MKRLALLVPVVLLAGCAGSSPSGGASKADYLKKAEAICAKANADQKALPKPTAVDTLSPYVAKVVAIADEATAALKALTVPAADSKALEDKVFRPLETQLATARDYSTKVTAASAAKDQAALMKLLGDPPTKPLVDLRWMKSYGFKVCVDLADTSN